MIIGINESKTLTKHIYHGNANVNLMGENIIQIKSGIIIYVDASVKTTTYVKNITYGILLHVVTRIYSKYYG